MNYALYLALRIVAALVPHVPLRALYRAASLAGTCAYYLFPTPRRAIAANLAVVLRSEPAGPVVQRAVREAFRYDAKNWIDTLRIDALSREQILGLVDVEGWEHLEAALSEGHGLIVAILHLGNIDLVGQVLLARGWRLTVPVEHMRPHQLFDFLASRRRSQGMNIVPVEHAARDMLRALRNGEIVAIACDRNLDARGVEVEFFGRRTQLPRAAAVLAERTGAPVLVGLGVRTASNRFHGFVTPRIPMLPGNGDGVAENTRRILAQMEGFIRQYPDQWLMFSRVWPEGNDERGRATIDQPSEAAV